MKNIVFISTNADRDDYHQFIAVAKYVYNDEPEKIALLNNPVKQHLHSCHVMLQNDLPIGRFAFYMNPLIKHANKKTAILGSYECIDDDEAASSLLDYAKNLAKQHGCNALIGPMEGSTWNNYRFSVYDEKPLFFMEPYHKAYYNTQWTDNGFQLLAEYVSNIDENVEDRLEALQKVEAEFKKQGAKFRNIDLSNFEEEIRKIGAFSIDAFSKNYMYSPLTEDEFLSKYSAYKNYFAAELIWIVEDQENQIQAIIFTIPDHLDSAKETLILKSLARRKDSAFKGMRSYFSHKVKQIAFDHGYQKIIHAFLYLDNVSQEISNAQGVKQYKKYGLYSYEC